MSSLQRKLDGDVLVRHLRRDEQTIDAALVAKHGRSARTIVKEGALRLTLMALAPSGDLPIHDADGPVSIHLLDGDVAFVVAGEEHALAVGDVMVIAPGVPHSARSQSGCTFLLTVVHQGTGEPSPVV